MQDIRQKHVGNGNARPDPQRRRKIERPGAPLEVAHQLHDARGLVIKRPSGTRKVDFAGDAVKQHASRFPFELGDDMRYGRLGHIQPLCGTGKTHFLAHGAENGKLAQVHGSPNTLLYIYGFNKIIAFYL
ncbi:MAG: hypothetical protein DELT_03166 [Desulfovibrio sp.]